MTRQTWLLILALSVLWGGSFFFIAVALPDLPPLTLVAVRLGLSALVLQGVVAASGHRMPGGGRAWGAFFVMGLLNNAIPFTLISWGEQRIASGLASILNATVPVFTVLAAHVLTRDERLTPARAVGVTAGLAGAVVMVGPDALSGLGGAVLGQAAVLAAAVSYALTNVFGRRFRRMGLPPLVAAAGQVTASAALIIPLALVVDRPWKLPMPSAETLWAMIGLALFSTVLAYILFFRILARAGATGAALVTFLIPVSAILLGVLVLGEMLLARHVAGMALIAAGLACIDGRVLGPRG